MDKKTISVQFESFVHRFGEWSPDSTISQYLNWNLENIKKAENNEIMCLKC